MGFKLNNYRTHHFFLSEFLLWAEKEASDGDVVLTDFFGDRRICYVMSGRKFRLSVVPLLGKSRVTFILCEKNKLEEFVEQLQLLLRLSNKKEWECIFSSFNNEVWEDPVRFKGDKPTRFGLSDGEKQDLLFVARKTIRHFLITGDTISQDSFANLTGRLHTAEKQTADVALWVDGEMRGSIIKTESTLCQAIISSAVKSCRDSRFKPLAYSEFNKLRIQITILSGLHLPLLVQEKIEHAIDTKNGYKIVYENKKGFYLPTVFNVLKFSNMAEFCKKLTLEKAGIEEKNAIKASLFSFSVEDFIETVSAENKTTEVLALCGPVTQKTKLVEDTSGGCFLSMFNKAADWIVNLQQADGYIPATVDPRLDMEKHSLARMLFTAHALGEFAVVSGNKKYLDSSKRVFDYARSLLGKISEADLGNLILEITYFGQLAQTLGKKEEVFEYTQKVKDALSKNVEIAPLVLNQVATFFYGANVDSESSLGLRAHVISEIVLDNFEKEILLGNSISLANYAESVTLLHRRKTIGEERPAASEARYRKIVDWFFDLQNTDGSFPNTQFDKFVYTRGTSKIFEVLTIDKGNEDAYMRVLNWLYTMQYDEKNTFFMSESQSKKSIGGFRHDMQNYDIWIDTAGHLLLGAARILKREKDSRI